jgi:hypothetical protein
VDSEFVYWIDSGARLVRCPRRGCDDGETSALGPQNGPSSLVPGRVVLLGDWLYVMYSAGDRRIARIPRAGGSDETVYTADAPLSVFDVQSDGVYFATSILTGRVLRCPLSGACTNPEVFAENQRWPVAVTAGWGSVFWANSLGHDLELMRLGPEGEPLEVTSRPSFGGSLVDDATHVYWKEPGGLEGIVRVAK